MEAALRENYAECGVHRACYEPPLAKPSLWPGAEAWILIGLLILLIVLLFQFAKPPKKPLRERVLKVLDDSKTQAQLWDRGEAARAFDSARIKIDQEFRDSGM